MRPLESIAVLRSPRNRWDCRSVSAASARCRCHAVVGQAGAPLDRERPVGPGGVLCAGAREQRARCGGFIGAGAGAGTHRAVAPRARNPSVIVAAGPLARLPFAALPAARGQDVAPLMFEHDISYLPSLTLFEAGAPRTTVRSAGACSPLPTRFRLQAIRGDCVRCRLVASRPRPSRATPPQRC